MFNSPRVEFQKIRPQESLIRALPSPVPLADAASKVFISLYPHSFPCEHSVFRNEAATRVFLFTCLAETWLMTPVGCIAHVCVKSFQWCLTLCDPIDCSPSGSSVHGILQARRLEWVAMPSSRGSSRPRDRTHVSFITGGLFTTQPLRKPGKPLNTV